MLDDSHRNQIILSYFTDAGADLVYKFEDIQQFKQLEGWLREHYAVAIDGDENLAVCFKFDRIIQPVERPWTIQDSINLSRDWDNLSQAASTIRDIANEELRQQAAKHNGKKLID